MDFVLALTLEWTDARLKWNEREWSGTPIRSIQVDSDKIWTPNIDIANRIHDYSPGSERYLKATVQSDGKISIALKIFNRILKAS